MRWRYWQRYFTELYRQIRRIKKMVIYIHIPFCIQKCHYCDFLSAPCDAGIRERYVECLIREIEYYGEWYGMRGRNIPVTSIFFGGGTPSILESNQIQSIMDKLKTTYSIEKNAEITMECNPGTVTEEKLSGYRVTGINRLSIGLQSANNAELKSIGRIHTYEQFLNSYDMARKCGFKNINVDLMSALPGQTLESYRNTIEKVLDVKPEHISAYSLILEEGTPLYERIEQLEEQKMPTGLPDEDTEREMYYMTERMLKDAGYERYEISNYARTGYECKHNTAYWRRDDYLGMGIGAASCIDDVRMKNITDIGAYMDIYEKIDTRDDVLQKDVSERNIMEDNALDKDETDVLSDEDKMEEFMFLGLRMMRGISKKEFERQFNVKYDMVYGAVTAKLIKEGLIEASDDNDSLWLTPLGIDVSNMVLSQFIVT
ncbi:MAG: oxygen-independent coproporphyrinogen III oxidase [Lachnospiraceae bacterium]|nr:oxygen-independent coproporphyrinogen III oxidase [Lachnospiraceae bacterium]